jgi:hypothetical protein
VRKSQGLGRLLITGEFHKTFFKELILILLKLFQKLKKEEILPNHSMRLALP